MKRILCYGDSNTWAYAPELYDDLRGAAGRYGTDIRWTGRLASALGPGYTVIEEGYNGRTTVFDDPVAVGRNGQKHLEVAFRSHEPLDLIIIMLGTNDTKDLYAAPAVTITAGLERLIKELTDSLRRSISHNAKVLIAAPIRVAKAGTGEYLFGFSESAEKKSAQLPALYSALAEKHGLAFIDVSLCAAPGSADGIHLDPAGHASVASAMESKIRELIG
jgi:lysophospholipase L1-like esterase